MYGKTDNVNLYAFTRKTPPKVFLTPKKFTLFVSFAVTNESYNIDEVQEISLVSTNLLSEETNEGE